MVPIDFPTLEAVIRQDPGGRGVAGFRYDGDWLAKGMLEGAAKELAANAHAVGIVTGFCVADVDPPAAETDGPPGALYLASAIETLGKEVVLISDRFAIALLDLGCRVWRLNAELFEVPLGRQDASWLHDFFDSSIGRRLSHLIAIERVGPSHTVESFSAQHRSSPAPLDSFLVEAPERHRDVCHNMRGVNIDHCTAPAHRLFEAAELKDRGVKTIGIGDGGNEIGMGSIPWENLRVALNSEQAGRIICRIPTDYLILAGVSNWGAYALACAVMCLRGRSELIDGWGEEHEGELIESLVREGGAIDGLTRRRETTVDGLSLDRYLDVLKQIRITATSSSVGRVT